MKFNVKHVFSLVAVFGVFSLSLGAGYYFYSRLAKSSVQQLNQPVTSNVDITPIPVELDEALQKAIPTEDTHYFDDAVKIAQSLRSTNFNKLNIELFKDVAIPDKDSLSIYQSIDPNDKNRLSFGCVRNLNMDGIMTLSLYWDSKQYDQLLSDARAKELIHYSVANCIVRAVHHEIEDGQVIAQLRGEYYKKLEENDIWFEL